MKVAILLTIDHRLLSVAAMLDVLETVNTFYPAPVFEIDLLYAENQPGALFDGYNSIHVDEASEYKLILVPAFQRAALPGTLASNRSFVPFLNRQYNGGADIASFCTGAFLLGVSGLLDNKPATTHIDASPAFANAFPNVDLQADAVLTYDDRIYTSGGATNTFHLLLRLIENHCGRTIAVKTAKVFSIDMGRKQQGYFKTYLPDDSHGDDLVKMAQDKIKANYSDATVDQIMCEVPASRRNLARRFKQATGTTLIEYLQMIRIEAARRLLEQSSHSSVMEVMLESGYNDLKSFRILFKKNVGMTPKAYREKFGGSRVAYFFF
jgi:transcriptional regulator GlxA family with amidase domain